MRIKTEINTYLALKDEYGKIQNQQILIIGKSGYGKGLATEGLVEELHRAGYIVLCLSDVKDEFEFAYQMFKPDEIYHINHLKKIGKKPQGKKVKIYHPFTFSIPKEYLPEIIFYSLSLKDLGRKEWGILAETDWDTETMRLLLNASQNITKEDGIYGFVHYIQDAVKGKRIEKSKRADPKNFYLEATSGKMTAVSDISNYLQPFKRDYFLTKDSCSLNINWESILNDQEHYHVFTTKWIKDEKLKDFTVLALLNGLMVHKDILKRPVVVIIPEIRKLCPFKPQGHKIFLAQSIKETLSLMRSSGRGMSSILDSQVWIDVDEDVRNSATVTLLGEIGGGGDMEKIAKAFNYKRNIRDQLKKADYPNSFLMVGNEEIGGITIFFPSGCHAEPQYNFIEMYKNKRFPVKKYSELIENMKIISKEESEKFKERILREERGERERRKKEKIERERFQIQKQKADEKIGKAKEIEQQSKEQIMKLCWEMYHDESLSKKDRSHRKIGTKYGIDKNTASKYINDYQKILDEMKREDE